MIASYTKCYLQNIPPETYRKNTDQLANFDNTYVNCIGANIDYYVDVFYKNCYCAAFYTKCIEYPDGTIQSDINWIGTFSNIFYYESCDYSD